MKNPLKNKIGVLDYYGTKKNPLGNKPYSKKYKKLSKIWKNYKIHTPATYKKFFNMLDKNQVIIFTAGTGVGKSTQVPKLVLHYLNYKENIICTQPRTMPTQSVSSRIANELDVTLGTYVGYKFKGDSTHYSPRDTKILFVTDGLFLNEAIDDPFLSSYGAVIIDEAHERNINIDIILYILHENLKHGYNKNLKVIIMSATANTKKFLHYFKCCNVKHINIPGKQAKKKIIHIPRKIKIKNNDFNIITDIAVEKVYNILDKTNEGDILVFLPTKKNCKKATTKLDELKINLKQKIFTVPLYAGLSEGLQNIITSKTIYKKKYDRKVVFSTDVAETSLTIDGLKYVIDSGLSNQTIFYHTYGYSDIKVNYGTQDKLKQRWGRVGRTDIGYVHCLYTKSQFNKFKEFVLPKILKEPIDNQILYIMTKLDIHHISDLKKAFNNFIDFPNKDGLHRVIKKLTHMKALENNEITPLGKYLGSLGPIFSLEEGLMLLNAPTYNCVQDIITIVAMLQENQYKSMQNVFIGEKNEKYYKTIGKFIGKNDYETLIKLFRAYNAYISKNPENAYNWCEKNYVNYGYLKKVPETREKIELTVKEIYKKIKKDKYNMPKKIGDRKNKLLYCILTGYFMKVGIKNKFGNYNIKEDIPELNKKIKLKYQKGTFYPGMNIKYKDGNYYREKVTPKYCVYNNFGSYYDDIQLNIITNIPNMKILKKIAPHYYN